ncbi:MAG: bifunctional folylpolyglutamate synthase/dihydrofolate synthase [Myxococcales bacterium]|nr:bifunctional folylpolyglutamate synthase/dihydrofolate synthase [Myxococcales bacterium]
MAERPPIRTANDAADWLEGLINLEKQPELRYERLGLDPIRALLSRLGDPHTGLRVIHIAGSKGKGSTALFAESLLRAAGLRVGTFTSPHLERWTERFRIDGEDVVGSKLAAAVHVLRPHVETQRAGDAALVPSFFDATTAAALVLFREARVDCAVLEVGLGGRLDSTNAVDPAVTCVTPIELEHTETLGSTLEAIAAEKAGILKPRVPAVMGALDPRAAKVVRERAHAVGAPLAECGRDFQFRTGPARGRESSAGFGQRVTLTDGAVEIDANLGVVGAHQAQNAALAVACVRRAGLIDDETLARTAAAGLAATRLPGRLEIFARDPWIVVDSAHTKRSAEALAGVLRELRKGPGARTHLVVSISADKDTQAVLRALLPQVDQVTITRAEPTRSMDPNDVARAIESLAPDVASRVVPNPHLAVRAAYEALGPGDGLCIAGSVYLAGIARSVLRSSTSNPAAVSRSSRSSDGSPLERA